MSVLSEIRSKSFVNLKCIKLKDGSIIPHQRLVFFQDVEKVLSKYACIERKKLELLDICRWLDDNHKDGEKWALYGADLAGTLIKFREELLQPSEEKQWYCETCKEWIAQDQTFFHPQGHNMKKQKPSTTSKKPYTFGIGIKKETKK